MKREQRTKGLTTAPFCKENNVVRNHVTGKIFKLYDQFPQVEDGDWQPGVRRD